MAGAPGPKFGLVASAPATRTHFVRLLAEDDVIHLAAAMHPGSTARVLIYENVSTAPVASAVLIRAVS
ncbi:MAG: hypothetical protein ACXWD8_20175 [Mycobacterium sp.]